jgi:hypothetical protein
MLLRLEYAECKKKEIYSFGEYVVNSFCLFLYVVIHVGRNQRDPKITGPL